MLNEYTVGFFCLRQSVWEDYGNEDASSIFRQAGSAPITLGFQSHREEADSPADAYISFLIVCSVTHWIFFS